MIVGLATPRGCHRSFQADRQSCGPGGCKLPRICCEYDSQPNRLFSRREAQGAPSEVVEVGDLSRRENKPDSTLVGLFSDHDDGQQGRKGSPQGTVGQAPLPTPAMAPGVMGHQLMTVRVEIRPALSVAT
jgi:hypothetical protein